MKSYTDIEQSKKLAEILPFESADMYYGYKKDKPEYLPYSDTEVVGLCFPCWSLSALLALMPERIKIGEELSFCLTSKKSLTGFSFGYNLNGSTFVQDNPLDAAFEMICWLKQERKI